MGLGLGRSGTQGFRARMKDSEVSGQKALIHQGLVLEITGSKKLGDFRNGGPQGSDDRRPNTILPILSPSLISKQRHPLPQLPHHPQVSPKVSESMSGASRPLPSFCTFHPTRIQPRAVRWETCQCLPCFLIPWVRTQACFLHLCAGWIWI